jgi:hypothetical protein
VSRGVTLAAASGQVAPARTVVGFTPPYLGCYSEDSGEIHTASSDRRRSPAIHSASSESHQQGQWWDSHRLMMLLMATRQDHCIRKADHSASENGNWDLTTSSELIPSVWNGG